MPYHFKQWAATEGDYFLFVLLVLVALLVVSMLLRFRNRSARLPLALWIICPIVLWIGWELVESAGERARLESKEQISELAPTYAYEMEQMGHALLASDAATNDPLYLKLIQAEIQWQRLNPFAHDIYTMRKRADGANIFIVDSESDYNHNGVFDGDIEQRTPIGTVYTEPDLGMERAFKGEANFDTQIITDKWGTWISAFVPMRDADGNVEAILGVDYNAGLWLKRIAQARRTVIGLVGLIIAIIVGGGVAISTLRQDVERRALAERRSRAAEERMQLTIRQMPLGFIEWSAPGQVVIWNPAAQKILGYSAEEVKGRDIMPLVVPPDARAQVDEVWVGLFSNTGGIHSVNNNITKDGRIITCEWFNTPLVDRNGKVVGVLSLFQDVTGRLSLERQLQRSDRMNAIGQIAAGVAHDFNNILTIITGHTGIMLGQPGLPAEFRGELARIEGAAMRAATLTRQLLAFSSRQAMFPKPLHLARVVEGVASMLSRLLGEDVKLHLDIVKDVPPIEADPAMIEQVITNLVLNARDALPNGGDITLAIDVTSISRETAALNPDARAGLAVCLSVTDNGTGITSEHQQHIFEPFYTTKPKGKGTGLGLSVVHGIIKQHRGWITLDSIPGKGSTFCIFFPPTNKPVPDEPAEKHPLPMPAPQSVRTILLVEDEQGVRDLARTTLERAGYTIIAAPDGPSALKLWRDNSSRIDLLLTDMVMPNGMTGRELSLRLLAERPDLPVIYASGYSLELTAPGFAADQRTVFLAKPYLTQQLLATVRQCLGQDA